MVIEIGNSYSRVIGLTTDQYRELRKEFSYTINPQAVYFSGAYKAYPRYLVDSKGNFPSGLIPRVVQFMRKAGYSPSIKDCRKEPHRGLPRRIERITPYLAQSTAARVADNTGCGGIIMPTGTGKSLVIAMVIAQYNVNTLVVVPTVQLKIQLTESLKTLLGDISHITVENIDSTSLSVRKPYDMLIIDECHHAAAATYQKLNKTAWKDIYYRFFFTATYFRNQTNEHLLFEGICGPAIYQLSYREAISNRYIVPVEAYYYNLPRRRTNAYTWNGVYSELVINNEYRNKLIKSLLAQLSAQGCHTLCLVKEIAHGKILERLTGIPFANGADDSSRQYINQFNKGEIKALIGTTGVLGEGIDTKPAEYVIIAGLGKAKSAFLQQIGRGVRTYPGKESCKIILFKDSSHKFTLQHYREQVRILNEELEIKPILLEDI